MAEQPNQPFPDYGPELPPELAAALRGIDDAPVEVPAAVDQAILRDARAGYWQRRRFRLIIRWVGATAAAAAAVGIVAMNLPPQRTHTDVIRAKGTGDLHGNG